MVLDHHRDCHLTASFRRGTVVFAGVVSLRVAFMLPLKQSPTSARPSLHSVSYVPRLAWFHHGGKRGFYARPGRPCKDGVPYLCWFCRGAIGTASVLVVTS